MNPNYLNIIGLAVRARKCSTGEDTIIKDIRKGRAKLVLLAEDIGPQTKRNFRINVPRTIFHIDLLITGISYRRQLGKSSV